MNRRTALKNLGFLSGSIITVPSWVRAAGLSNKLTHQSSFTIAEQNLLASFADTVIPAGKSIGAITEGVDKFLQQLFDDCYEKPVQDNIKYQLNALGSTATNVYSRSFTDCDQKQREALLLKLASSSDKDQKEFYELVKSETIRGFITSKKVMVEYLGYKVAPGRYLGSVSTKS